MAFSAASFLAASSCFSFSSASAAISAAIASFFFSFTRVIPELASVFEDSNARTSYHLFIASSKSLEFSADFASLFKAAILLCFSASAFSASIAANRFSSSSFLSASAFSAATKAAAISSFLFFNRIILLVAVVLEASTESISFHFAMASSYFSESSSDSASTLKLSIFSFLACAAFSFSSAAIFSCSLFSFAFCASPFLLKAFTLLASNSKTSSYFEIDSVKDPLANSEFPSDSRPSIFSFLSASAFSASFFAAKSAASFLSLSFIAFSISDNAVLASTF